MSCRRGALPRQALEKSTKFPLTHTNVWYNRGEKVKESQTDGLHNGGCGGCRWEVLPIGSRHILCPLLARSDDGYVEVRRYELADQFSCVPSQVTYVLYGRGLRRNRGFFVERTQEAAATSASSPAIRSRSEIGSTWCWSSSGRC